MSTYSMKILVQVPSGVSDQDHNLVFSALDASAETAIHLMKKELGEMRLPEVIGVGLEDRWNYESERPVAREREYVALATAVKLEGK